MSDGDLPDARGEADNMLYAVCARAVPAQADGQISGHVSGGVSILRPGDGVGVPPEVGPELAPPPSPGARERILAKVR